MKVTLKIQVVTINAAYIEMYKNYFSDGYVKRELILLVLTL